MKIQIVSTERHEVIKSIDVTGKSKRQIEKIEDGMNINLDHDHYFTRLVTE